MLKPDCAVQGNGTRHGRNHGGFLDARESRRYEKEKPLRCCMDVKPEGLQNLDALRGEFHSLHDPLANENAACTLEEPPMSLFQAIVDSIANPQHAGSNSDLQGLLNLAELIPGVQDTEQHVKPILDVLGPHLQDVLANQQQTQGQAAAQQTVTNLSQPGVGVQELQNLFGADRFNSIIGEIAGRTGLDQQVILGALPIVIPIIMKLLASGTNQSNPQAQNPVLSSFLAGQNGGALLTEALSLASQFVKR